MKFYPTEIANKTFDRKMMGFDPEQVVNFLTVIAAQTENLAQQIQTLTEELKEKELQLHEYRDRDNVLRSAITQATKMTDQMKAEAEHEVKIIISDAQQKAETITRDA
ncbi:MAG: DivIVA domain-containing protein, partial [Pseudobdellovibrio sp.]|nr:DivIVA domain-containing protein [Pseudobdellovibrio sp.]